MQPSDRAYGRDPAFRRLDQNLTPKLKRNVLGLVYAKRLAGVPKFEFKAQLTPCTGVVVNGLNGCSVPEFAAVRTPLLDRRPLIEPRVGGEFPAGDVSAMALLIPLT